MKRKMSNIKYEEVKKATYDKVTIHQLINFDKKPKNPIKVSIVVPVCNVEMYLRECLDSAINQTLEDIEIICVNDGSKDNSLSILEEYAAKDDRVKVIDKDNAGYGHAMNIGMDMAQGEYIGILESDDYVKLDMYEELYNIAEETEVDFVKGDFYRFFGSGEKLQSEYNKIAREDKYYNVVIKPSEEQECFKFIMNTWSGIYRTEFLTKNNIRHNETPGASFQDNGFWFKANVSAEKTWYTNKAFYMNRRDNPNSSVYNPEKVYCANTEYNMIYKELENNGVLNEFLEVYNYKKFHSYMFTLHRIAPMFRKEYLTAISKEFAEMEEKGELVSKYLSSNDWNTLRWIMRNPDEYYYNVVCREVKVSVILPVYNVAPYLPQCIESLLSQTLKNIEIICINDGSTDDSLQILQDYQAKDHRVRIVDQENKGAGAARNIGIKMAEGQYLSFLDADDYFDKNMLKKAYDRAENNNADICIYGSMLFDNATGEKKKCTFSVRKDKLPKSNVFSRTQINGNLFTSIMGWAWDKLYKKSFVLNNNLWFQEQRTTNDMYFVYASLLRAGRITLLDEMLYFQRRNVSTSLSNSRELSWECFYYALMKVKKELEDMAIYDEYEHDFVNYALHSCLWNFNSLKEPIAEKLFHKLREKWFEDLGISTKEEDYFDGKAEYEQYMEIMQIPLNDEMAYMEYKINYWKNKYQYDMKYSLMSVSVKISENEILSIGQMKEKLIWNRKQREILEKQVKDVDKKSIEKLNEELARYKYELEETRKSKTYKLARAITWLPRKFRKEK